MLLYNVCEIISQKNISRLPPSQIVQIYRLSVSESLFTLVNDIESVPVLFDAIAGGCPNATIGVLSAIQRKEYDATARWKRNCHPLMQMGRPSSVYAAYSNFIISL